jgi:hypothetical protein
MASDESKYAAGLVPLGSGSQLVSQSDRIVHFLVPAGMSWSRFFTEAHTAFIGRFATVWAGGRGVGMSARGLIYHHLKHS